jgi:hypothetical protein
MKWITREQPKIDRIACPWLIKRFIDKEAQFLYVPKNEVLAVAQAQGAIPYDIAGVELTHEGELCSFDKFLSKYDLLGDAALVSLAKIVRCRYRFSRKLASSARSPCNHARTFQKFH